MNHKQEQHRTSIHIKEIYNKLQREVSNSDNKIEQDKNMPFQGKTFSNMRDIHNFRD
jgi:hypothetical protein